MGHNFYFGVFQLKFVLCLLHKNVCFRIFTFINKIYQIFVTNALFFVINYSSQILTNKILIKTIMLFEVYNLQLIFIFVSAIFLS